MLGGGTAGKSLEQLQKAVMGMDPSIQPFEALSAIQRMVKDKEMKTAQLAGRPQQPQTSVAQRKMMEAAALRNPYMAAGLGAAPVASPVSDPAAQAAPQAPVGMAGGGMVAFAKGGITPYESGFEPLTPEERIANRRKYLEEISANNAEFLDPIKANVAKYEEEAAKRDKYAFNDALIAAGLGMMAGKSQYAMQNIGEGGLKGLAAYQDAQKLGQAAREKGLAAQADLAKSRIALEKGDEATATAMQNQERQEAQARGQYNLLGQYYAGNNAAQLAAANARAGLAGGSDKHLAALTRVQAVLNNDPAYKKAAEKATLPGKFGEEARRTMQEREEVILKRLAPELLAANQQDTIPRSSPGAGAGGKDKVIDFSSI